LWRVRQRWLPGDALVLDLPMTARLTTADPRVDAVHGCVALETLARVHDLAAAGWPYRAGRRAGTSARGHLSIQSVPYSTWGNRHRGQTMRVRLPTT
jgi:DUF1680 family protein